MNDEGAERLLRFTGVRREVAPERRARVHEAVKQTWMATVSRRRARWGRTGGILAAAAAVVAAVIYVASLRTTSPVSAHAAVVERVTGMMPLAVGASLPPGARIETPRGAGIDLRLPGIGSLRVHEETRLQIVSPAVVDLSSGAVYAETVTTGPGLEVTTPFGRARDIGTRFEVRVSGETLTVRVRSGAVELHHPRGASTAREGTQLTLSGGRVVQTAIRVDGPEWSWTRTGATPPMEGATLAGFLDRAAGVEGWTVQYATETLRVSAQTIVLHGSVDGLSPADAIGVAIATSGLGYRIENRTILVFRP